MNPEKLRAALRNWQSRTGESDEVYISHMSFVWQSKGDKVQVFVAV
jgi:hypothetical protein